MTQDTQTDTAVSLHQTLVDSLVEKGHVLSEAVESAFRAVPRHPFLPDVALEYVYTDDAIPTHFDENGRAISSSSQPAIMAIMLEQLALQPGHRVLEVGAGTGYNAALMAHLVGPQGQVTTMDIGSEIVNAAREHLDNTGSSQVAVICGDGMEGYAAHAPYDRIILTASSSEIAPAWLEQLKPDGRLLLPLSLKGPQYAIAFERQDGGGLASVSINACGFMNLRGPNARPHITIPLNAEQTIRIDYEKDPSRPRRLDAGRLQSWLAGPGKAVTTSLQVTPREIWGGLSLWLALHEPQLVHLSARGAAAETIPFLAGSKQPKPWAMTIGVVNKEGMAFYERRDGRETAVESPESEPDTFELQILSFGRSHSAARQLRQQALAWDAAGRPGEAGMRVRVYPADSDSTDNSHNGETILTGRWHNIIIDWP